MKPPDFDTVASRSICGGATPDPWGVILGWFGDGSNSLVTHTAGTVAEVTALSSDDGAGGQNDARFIAYARSALPVALDIIDALRDENAELTQALRVAEDEAEMLRGLVSDRDAGRPIHG